MPSNQFFPPNSNTRLNFEPNFNRPFTSQEYYPNNYNHNRPSGNYQFDSDNRGQLNPNDWQSERSQFESASRYAENRPIVSRSSNAIRQSDEKAKGDYESVSSNQQCSSAGKLSSNSMVEKKRDNDKKANAEILVEDSHAKRNVEQPKNVVLSSPSNNNDMSIISVSDSVSRNIGCNPGHSRGNKVPPSSKVLKFMDSNKVVREYHWVENLFKFNGKDHIKKDGILIEILLDNSVSDEYQNKYFW